MRCAALCRNPGRFEWLILLAGLVCSHMADQVAAQGPAAAPVQQPAANDAEQPPRPLEQHREGLQTGLKLLLWTMLLGIWLMLGTMLFGWFTRRVVRRPLPPAPAGNPLWFLKPRPTPSEKDSSPKQPEHPPMPPPPVSDTP